MRPSGRRAEKRWHPSHRDCATMGSVVPNSWQSLACALGAFVIAAGGAPGGIAQDPRPDPFAFLAPSIVVSTSERSRLERDQVVVRTLSGKNQVAVFVASPLKAPPEALVRWTHAIAAFKRSRFVQGIARLSDPPVLSDFDGLRLDDRDLDAIRKCSVSHCDVRLSAAEIESLSRVRAAAGDAWREAVQREFRRLLFERVRDYRSRGLAGVPAPADRKDRPTPVEALNAIVKESPYLASLPAVTAWLQNYPRDDLESFLYWSKEAYGDGKPVVSLTHVGIARPEPGRGLPLVVVVGKQIFATHYLEGSLSMTMVVRDPSSDATYLAYLNRSQVDLFRGFFGGLVRSIFKGRVERLAPDVLRQLRVRLESGIPPQRVK